MIQLFLTVLKKGGKIVFLDIWCYKSTQKLDFFSGALLLPLPSFLPEFLYVITGLAAVSMILK